MLYLQKQVTLGALHGWQYNYTNDLGTGIAFWDVHCKSIKRCAGASATIAGAAACESFAGGLEQKAREGRDRFLFPWFVVEAAVVNSFFYIYFLIELSEWTMSCELRDLDAAGRRRMLHGVRVASASKTGAVLFVAIPSRVGAGGAVTGRHFHSAVR